MTSLPPYDVEQDPATKLWTVVIRQGNSVLRKSGFDHERNARFAGEMATAEPGTKQRRTR